MLNFKLDSNKNFSKTFLEFEVQSFSEAMNFIKNLPYGRNSNRKDFELVLKEQQGTCSSKHALLKSLADENQHFEVKLMLGIFKMNGINTPKVKNTLNKYSFEYIPEAHNYIKIEDKIFDCTTSNSSELNFKNDLIQEIEIEPKQVIQFKIDHHQNFLKNWCQENNQNFDEIWKIREECISALSSK